MHKHNIFCIQQYWQLSKWLTKTKCKSVKTGKSSCSIRQSSGVYMTSKCQYNSQKCQVLPVPLSLPLRVPGRKSNINPGTENKSTGWSCIESSTLTHLIPLPCSSVHLAALLPWSVKQYTALLWYLCNSTQWEVTNCKSQRSLHYARYLHVPRALPLGLPARCSARLPV